MTQLTRSGVPVGKDPPDAWMSFYGCITGAVAVPGFAGVAVRQHATSGYDLFLGVSAAVVSGVLLVLLGALGRQVHLAAVGGEAPWRSRRWELLSHVLGLAVLVFSGWALLATSPGVVGMVTGGLLVLSAYTALLCLGCWSTLSRSQRAGVDG